MRMKMFAAESLAAAKAMIFAEMGDDAIILSERKIPGGVEVRAATDKLGGGMVPTESHLLTRLGVTPDIRKVENPLRNRVRDALIWHGAPQRFADRLADLSIENNPDTKDPATAMAAGLDHLMSYKSLGRLPKRDILLVGAPGHGRTATAAKLTRRAAAKGAKLMPVAADLDATAGRAQLAAYLKLENRQIRSATSPDTLLSQLERLRAAKTRCVIDLPAIIPSDKNDMSSLTDLAAVIRAEPVLVISAEGHPEDQAEAARAFAAAGVKRAIITKLDVVRRRGGIVSALSAARISLTYLVVTPFIGGGLIEASSNRLAKVLLEDSAAEIALKGAKK